MNKILIACIAATCFGGLAQAATPQTYPESMQPVIVTGEDITYKVAKLQGEVQTLQTEMQGLSSTVGQVPGDPSYAFSATPLPNSDNSPIPTGG
jgi:hypothetical protein